MNIKNLIASNLKYIGGKTTNRKLVVFESDDWGSNRIASKEALYSLKKIGVLNDNSSHYDKYDTIARTKDLEILFETLTCVKDCNGNNAVFTTFLNPVNPDFERIKQDNYQNYYYETFFETLNRTGEREQVETLWMQGLSSNIFSLAYHSREHLCFPLWMDFLKKGEPVLRQAMDHNFYSVPLEGLPHWASSFRPPLFFTNKDQKEQIKKSLIEGIHIIKKMFGTFPYVFCPGNGISHIDFDKVLSHEGVIAIVTNRFRKEPDGKGKVRHRYMTNSWKNEFGQMYYYRNSCFEPTYSKNSVNFCLDQIKNAFRWHKPAIICSHRVNYIGFLDPSNRDKGLKELRTLLQQIVKRWPDVEFISSNDYAKILFEK